MPCELSFFEESLNFILKKTKASLVSELFCKYWSKNFIPSTNRFETDDGSEYRREEGRVNGAGANEISGEYSWTSPEGEVVSFTYVADENGYQAQGSHLPEAPPLHPHIQRGLELIARVNARNQAKRNRA